jgi:hypothetical protein
MTALDCRSLQESMKVINGEPVSAISFVMDYVEVHFNGPVLRCIANPTVVSPGEDTTFPEPGSRDRLCELIDRSLERVRCASGPTVVLDFSEGWELRIPFSADAAFAGESLHFVPELGAPVEVW